MNIAHVGTDDPSYTTKSAWRVHKEVSIASRSRTRKAPRARTWTESEERFLMESRNQRLPYKRIAARLQKSELACRLHHHQINTKRRPIFEFDFERSEDGGQDHDLLVVPRPSPSCSSEGGLCDHRVSPERLTLPGVSALLDDAVHRRSISLPENLVVPPRESRGQLTPPTYLLPPPRRLLSPFNEALAVTNTYNHEYTLPKQDAFHHPMHVRAASLTTGSPYDSPFPRQFATFSSPSSLIHTPRLSSSSSTHTPVIPADRCSVNSILNHHGSLTI